MRDVRVAYLQALLGARLVEVARDNVASLEVQRKNAEANYRQGVAAQNDVLKADVALSEAVQRERSTVKQLVVLRSNLNQLLDLDLQEKVELARNRGKNLPDPRPASVIFGSRGKTARIPCRQSVDQASRILQNGCPEPLLSACLRVCPILPGRRRFHGR